MLPEALCVSLLAVVVDEDGELPLEPVLPVLPKLEPLGELLLPVFALELDGLVELVLPERLPEFDVLLELLVLP
jgi:hypothetical protein